MRKLPAPSWMTPTMMKGRRSLSSIRTEKNTNSKFSFFKFPTFNITQQWKDNRSPFCNAALNHFGNNVVDGATKRKRDKQESNPPAVAVANPFCCVHPLNKTKHLTINIHTAHIKYSQFVRNAVTGIWPFVNNF